MPLELEDSYFIRTRNSDKAFTGDSLIFFELRKNSTVYILYDSRATGLPSWLLGWDRIGITVDVTDVGMRHYNVYSCELSQGHHWLGGNMADGAVNVGSMYTAIVRPHYTPYDAASETAYYEVALYTIETIEGELPEVRDGKTLTLWLFRQPYGELITNHTRQKATA